MTNQATLVGKRLSDRFLDDLKYLFVCPLVLLDATATVNGEDIFNAYLSVELLFKGHEWSPCILEFPLEGSNRFESIDKSYVKILSDYARCDNAIRTFFRTYASTLEYRGNGIAASDCVKPDTESMVRKHPFGNLNTLLAKNFGGVYELNPPLVLLDATATVSGTSSSDAYLTLELLFKGHELSPCILEFPLEGSKRLEATNKNYVKIVSCYMNSDRLIRTFFRDYASTLEYRGNGMTAQDCVKSDVQPSN